MTAPAPNRDATAPRPRLAAAAWAALFALFVVPAILVALHTARNFSGSAIDGPFQLYNALRRIAAGYSPGINFQFFHGMGVPFAHYWLFRLLGGRFQDSELARELLSTLLFPATLLLFFRGFVPRWAQALCLSAAAMAAFYMLRLPALLFALNSMVGLRSTLPVLIPVAIYRAPAGRARVAVVGTMLGLALFMSTEQGIAALGAFVAVSAIVILRAPARRTGAMEAVLTVGLALVVLVAALITVCGIRGAFGALRYNFTLVPMDQYWFFGAPPNPFIDTWAHALRALVGTPMIGLAILLGAMASLGYAGQVWVARGEDRRATALAFLTLYGLISCGSLLGVFVPVYSQACWRTLVLTALVELWFSSSRRSTDEQRQLLGVPRRVAAAALILSVFALVLSPQIIGEWLFTVPATIGSPSASLRFTPAGIWPATLAADQQITDAHRGPGGAPPLIWSTYTGWAEARNGTFNPSFDYIIHALGPANRRAYVEQFQLSRPALVQTVSPIYSPYETWIENTNWDFYHELLRHYVVSGETPWSIFWERRMHTLPAPALDTTMQIAAGQSMFRLPPAPIENGWPVTLLEVELNYTTHNPLRHVPIIGPTPRYLLDVGGALSRLPLTLDPYVTSMQVPILARPGDRPELHLRVSSLFSPATIAVTRIRVSSVPLDPRDEPWLRGLAVRAGY